MGLLVLITISIVWFLIINKAIQRKFKTPKRNWTWFKHDNKAFAALYYAIMIAFVVLIFTVSNTNMFILFPFFGALLNLLFAIEKYIYKKGERSYINHFSDAIFWLNLGVIAYIFFN